ncbi:MAG: prolyl oligopeptidase family protein, partial [Kordiimonas sp.]
LWRRASLRSYTSDEPKWVDILDVDKLAEEENENWVYKGRDCLAPDFGRCLVALSRGGGDAIVVREFDAVMKRFVPNGFVTEEAKQTVSWVDADTVLIATDFGNGTLTDSGYPNQVKLWKRGHRLEDARLLAEGERTQMGNFLFASHRADGSHVGFVRYPDFFTEIIFIMEGEDDEAEMRELILPREVSFKGIFASQVVIQLRADWHVAGTTYTSGSLVSVNVADAIGGTVSRSINTIYKPSGRTAVDSVELGKDRVFINVLDEVKGKLLSATLSGKGWETTPIAMPENGNISIVSADEWTDTAFVNYESFLQPDTLYTINRGQEPNLVKSLPARFDASNLVTEQQFATSKDGTKVPYFLIRHKDMPSDGTTPTMLYGYGGFEISLTPTYLQGVGKLWLEEGGAYAIANIRGGGEFGPDWHQAALKENRQRAYDDFIAIAERLIENKVTNPAKLGIRGGSNGGLLMGVMITQRPDLFGAVICAVPLLDMMRYHTLLAGASWMGEYGNPDILEERAYIRQYSPYQNLKSDAEYPEVFFYTSTKDDRVHPGHARKMAAKMTSMEKPVLYYENIEGGHSAAANLKQRAFTDALQVVYALKKLSD